MTRRTFMSSLLALAARTKLCVLEKFATAPQIPGWTRPITADEIRRITPLLIWAHHHNKQVQRAKDALLES